MEIMENGRDDGSPGPRRPGPPRRLMFSVAAALTLVVIGVGDLRHDDAKPAVPAGTPGPSPSVVAARVDTGSSISFETHDETKDFVVQVDLLNHSHLPVDVRAAGVGTDHSGFTRLAVAVLPAAQPGEEPGYADVAAAAQRAVALGWNETAQLTIAGRVACGTTMLTNDTMDILVDGVRQTVTLPDSGHGDWAAIARGMC